jgi:PAS domain S-box-containing protein
MEPAAIMAGAPWYAHSRRDTMAGVHQLLTMKTELAEQILNLRPSDHLCLFYDRDPAEQMPAIVPFVQQALQRDEQFVYVADDHTVEELTKRLEDGGIGVKHETDRGRLKLWPRREWRSPEPFAADEKAAQVRAFIDQAAAAGFKGLRFAVEMTWTLGPAVETRTLEAWEATINTLFTPTFPVRVVCQYNAARLSAEVMLAALRTHPLAILGDDVCPNIFYAAPFALNAAGDGAAPPTARVMLDWMVSQLKQTKGAVRRREALGKRHREDAEVYERLASIVESSDDAIISKDLNGVVVTWNKGAERIFGYTVDEMVGKPIALLIPPERTDEEPEILARLRRGERIDHYETVRVRKDGRRIDISLTVSPIRNADGNIVGASKIARDISERKLTERALVEAREQLTAANAALEARVEERTTSLRQTVEQLEEFSYSVSHDLRSPLRAMQGYATALLEDYGAHLDEQAREYLERIVRSGGRMDRLILDILTYSRLSRRDVPLHPVALDRLVREIVQGYPALQSTRADISIPTSLPLVVGHEPYLTQVLSNLLDNAVKFVPPGTKPRIRIWSEARDGNVRLWIGDNGIGIKPEHKARLFGMFERVHPEQHFEGTGIGLAIVRKAVERMGGTTGVESDGLSGSDFWIELPAGPAA